MTSDYPCYPTSNPGSSAMSNRFLLSLRLSFAAVLVLSALGMNPAFAGPFKLNAEQDDALSKPTGLGRGDVKPTSDAGAGQGEQPNFSVESMAPPAPPKKPFNLNAQDE